MGGDGKAYLGLEVGVVLLEKLLGRRLHLIMSIAEPIQVFEDYTLRATSYGQR